MKETYKVAFEVLGSNVFNYACNFRMTMNSKLKCQDLVEQSTYEPNNVTAKQTHRQANTNTSVTM